MFNFFKKVKPAANPATTIRDTLFGDLPPEQWPPALSSGIEPPWSTFVAARQHLAASRVAEAIACWTEVANAPGLESRFYAQAWHFLRQHGQMPPPGMAKVLLGVVIEVGMPKGTEAEVNSLPGGGGCACQGKEESGGR